MVFVSVFSKEKYLLDLFLNKKKSIILQVDIMLLRKIHSAAIEDITIV